jgi:Cu+-exporting ATPase
MRPPGDRVAASEDPMYRRAKKDGQETSAIVKDPVCGMEVTPGQAAGGGAEHSGTAYWFCNPSCRKKFVADPTRYVSPAAVVPPTRPPTAPAADTRIYTCPMHPEVRQVGPGSCPKFGMALEPVEAVAEEGQSPELVDMTRRFWVSLALTLPPSPR